MRIIYQKRITHYLESKPSYQMQMQVLGFQLIIKVRQYKWVLSNSTGKVFDSCIRDLKFNLQLHQKFIGILF